MPMTLPRRLFPSTTTFSSRSRSTPTARRWNAHEQGRHNQTRRGLRSRVTTGAPNPDHRVQDYGNAADRAAGRVSSAVASHAEFPAAPLCRWLSLSAPVRSKSGTTAIATPAVQCRLRHQARRLGTQRAPGLRRFALLGDTEMPSSRNEGAALRPLCST